ncbi:hypothetical protein [Enterobacter cloacae]|uniref:hypothetical protein n=1 Tax=Enterobacter cloacae TaxID=550 RepID=UPI000BB1C008|nr:hypothetical protein [Enterobacter cloacae]
MIGFVSALSSTLAIVVLIASVLFVNFLTFTKKKSETDFHLKLNKSIIKQEEGDYIPLDRGQEESSDSNLSGLSMSEHIISPKDLLSLNSNIKEIATGCYYGNNFSYEVASKLSTLNYIVLVKSLMDTNVKITLEEPKLDENKVNNCWVNMGDGDK